MSISTCALREEGDAKIFAASSGSYNFYPRPPRGGRRWMPVTKMWMQKFLSTPSARRATQRLDFFFDACIISIHALREEGDLQLPLCVLDMILDFYPRPPRGGRLSVTPYNGSMFTFLSTPSARRATSCARPLCLPVRYFYPRPPRGGRLAMTVMAIDIIKISIHALREEGDLL